MMYFALLYKKKKKKRPHTVCTHTHTPKIIKSQARQLQNWTQRSQICWSQTRLWRILLYNYSLTIPKCAFNKRRPKEWAQASTTHLLGWCCTSTGLSLHQLYFRLVLHAGQWWTWGVWSKTKTAVREKQLSEARALEIKPWKTTNWSLCWCWSF